MFKIVLQLHGGHSGGGAAADPIKKSAPGATSVATIDQATAEERAKTKEALLSGYNRNKTNKTQGTALDEYKKRFLGE